jgi:hypothetical protein
MPDYSLVPVDYQPDFDGYSLVPVDYDPFAADGVAQQWRIQQAQAQAQAQAQPQGPPQQQPAAGAGQPDAGAPAAGGGLTPLTENGRVDSYVYKKLSTGTPPAGPQVSTSVKDPGSHCPLRHPGDRSRDATPKETAQRRANHRHIFIVARIKPAPENPPRAF